MQVVTVGDLSVGSCYKKRGSEGAEQSRGGGAGMGYIGRGLDGVVVEVVR